MRAFAKPFFWGGEGARSRTSAVHATVLAPGATLPLIVLSGGHGVAASPAWTSGQATWLPRPARPPETILLSSSSSSSSSGGTSTSNSMAEWVEAVPCSGSNSEADAPVTLLVPSSQTLVPTLVVSLQGGHGGRARARRARARVPIHGRLTPTRQYVP